MRGSQYLNSFGHLVVPVRLVVVVGRLLVDAGNGVELKKMSRVIEQGGR